MPDRKTQTCAVAAVVAGLVAALTGLSAGAQNQSADHGRPAVGVIRRTEIRVAPEVSGRLASVEVTKDQHVKKGDLLAVFDIPEVSASVLEAKAALDKARADRDHVFAGTRQELTDISRHAVEIAQSNLEFAKLQYQRASVLAADAFASQEILDQRTAERQGLEASVASARAAYEQNKNGPTTEERQVAQANVALAEAALARVEASFAKTKLYAPADGEIGTIAAEPGEIVPSGRAVLTLAPENAVWISFTAREDALKGITIGSEVQFVTSNAIQAKGRITELRPLGEFATWRAARATGDHDLNSFVIRIEPIGKVADLQAGMTAWVSGPR